MVLVGVGVRERRERDSEGRGSEADGFVFRHCLMIGGKRLIMGFAMEVGKT